MQNSLSALVIHDKLFNFYQNNDLTTVYRSPQNFKKLNFQNFDVRAQLKHSVFPKFDYGTS